MTLSRVSNNVLCEVENPLYICPEVEGEQVYWWVLR